ncbi:hypothetical protein ACEYW6_34620 [Nostoc sp. UIC 10607]
MRVWWNHSLPAVGNIRAIQACRIGWNVNIWVRRDRTVALAAIASL